VSPPVSKEAPASREASGEKETPQEALQSLLDELRVIDMLDEEDIEEEAAEEESDEEEGEGEGVRHQPDGET